MISKFLLLSLLSFQTLASTTLKPNPLHLLFTQGIEQRNANELPEKVCLLNSFYKKVSCLEGYFYRDLEIDILRRTSIGLHEKLPFPDKKSPEHIKISWSLALGRLLVTTHHLKDVSLIPDSMKKTKYGKYFVDGWAYAAFSKFGFKEALLKCQKEFAQKPICLWGLGRSFYQNRTPLSHMRTVHSEFTSGFLFAKNIAKPFLKIKESTKTHSAIHISNHLLGNKFLKKELQLDTCLKESHPLECLYIF